jgi:hypothetical protein
VQQHDDVVEKSARNLAWALTIYTIAIPMLVARNTGRPTLIEAALGRAAAPTPRPVRPPAISTGRGEHPFDSAFYSIRATYLMWPFGGLVHIDDLDTVQSFTVRVLPMQLRRKVSVSSGATETEILQIAARQILPIGAWYDITDPRLRKRVAAVGHQIGGTWNIEDGYNQAIGVVKRKDMSLGSATYEAYLGADAVATFTWSSTPRPRVAVDFSRDPTHALDRRIGIAVGLLLFLKGSFASS